MVTGTLLALSLALSASVAQAVPVQPEAAGLPGFSDNPDPIKGKDAAKAKPRRVDDARKFAAPTLSRATWPKVGSAELAIPTSPPMRARSAGVPGPPEKADVGGLPIAVSPVIGKGRTGSSSPSKVKVTSLGEKKAARWGGAALLTVVRDDASVTAAPVRLSLDYSKFAEGAGGAYGSRLRVIELPACAATESPAPGCKAVGKPVESTNDPVTRTVTAEVAAAPMSSGAMVYALAAGDSSSKGDYKATSLSPSANWSVSNSSGAFSWNYPMRTVPTPGGLTPTVGLGYSAQSADGRTSATNNQGSWVGEGFSYEPGYVERSYKPCSEDGHSSSGEQCWAFDNATVMLNGAASSLIKDDTSGKWHFESESGAKIEQLTNANYVTGNGDNDGEHWKITTTDGTEYYFGLNRLPGWTTGKEETSSAWTAPVFGDDSGEPCYNATFASAHCKQAWRWNLDYVKDIRGNAMSYFYGAETNYYALNGKTDVNGTAYHRGGYLKRIDYGQRDNTVYSTKAPARVTFTTAERCLPVTAFDCAASKFTTGNAAYWPDTPVDRNCAANTKCTASQSTQTFWTTKRLVGITTQMSKSSVAGEYADVDAWTFTHLFTDNGDDTKTLWLAKIDHEGKAGGSDKMPSLELAGSHLMNRVDSDVDNTDPFKRLRLDTVVSETGAQLNITYAPQECTATVLPAPGTSTKRCFPVVWSPPGSITPKTDWFHKYVVQDIVETDRTGGGEDLVTHYDYQGAAGWRHAEPDGITDPKYLTWGQWQGYGKVVVTGGSGQTTATRIEYTYLQGLDGDTVPGGGTRSEKVKDSTGVEYTGSKEFTGFQIESKTYDHATSGKVVSKSISEPWKHETATQTRTWGTSHATLVKPGASRGYSLLHDGTWQETKSTSTYDTTVPGGRLVKTDDQGDVSRADDDTCTQLWYADTPAKNLYELPARSEAVTVRCAASPDRKTQVLADERTTYDGYGNAVKTERLAGHDGTTATYQVTGTTEYDAYGRPTLQKNAEQLQKPLAEQVATIIAYTDVNGLISQTKHTNLLGHITTTDYAPAWGVSSGQTDPNGKRTDLAYDGLGRLTSVWLADRTKTMTPSIKYSYNVRRDKTTVVKTEKIQKDGAYGAEYQHYDSLLRPRQLQTQGPAGTRMVGDVFYDGTGKPRRTNATYNAAGVASDELLIVAGGQVGAQTRFEYDGLGRTTAEIALTGGREQWRTAITYEGERKRVDPPVGGVPTTTITDAQGRVSEIRHHRTATSAPEGPGVQYDSTKYTYTPRGQLKTVTDAKDNVWSYEYDQLGRKTKSNDPDAGVTESHYDGMDRPTWSLNASEEKTSTSYDALGRPTITWAGDAGTGTKLTETRYDRAGALGEAYASIRWTGPTSYFGSVVQSRDALYRPMRVDYIVPASEGLLKGTYSFTTGYSSDGTVASSGMPAAGGLPTETFAYTYDELQRPVAMTGTSSINVTETLYTETSLLKGLKLSAGGGQKVQQAFQYEKGTDRLTSSRIDIEGVNAPAKEAQYSYDQAGNVLSISDLAGSSPDVQCFAYNSMQRLSEAWTPAATPADATGFGTVGGVENGTSPAACGPAPGTGPLGGPAAYWKSYTTDAIGNRTQDIVHDTGLDVAKNTTRTYTYGQNAGPHAVTKLVENTPTGDRQSLYTYDNNGNTRTRTISGSTQTLDWNAEGHLAKTTESDGKETTYLYDASGERVVRRDATATTIYLPGMELKLPKAQGATVEATRYYTFAGQTIAVRENNSTLSFLGSDHQGTSSLAINPATGAVSQRRFDPYGVSRGQTTGTFPGEKGFVGGALDLQTGLTHIGAREYDPGLGKFISVDSLIDYTQPQQINGYAYANNSPVTLSDPTGLAPCALGVADGGSYCGSPSCGMFCAPVESVAVDKAKDDEKKATTNLNNSKKKIKKAVQALVNIIKQELGIDAALDCFSSGDIGACGETALNVAGSFAGGLAGKLLAKYGLRWAKAANLIKTVAGHVEKLIDGIKDFFKYSEKLGKAKDALAAARAKVKSLAGKGTCPTPHSFLPGTKVLLDDGTTKNIEEVELGDKVAVTDPETGQTTTREVVGTIVTEGDKHFVNLTIENNTGNTSTLNSTTTHPFWVPSTHTWTDAGNLKPGMTLHTPTGDTATIEQVNHYNKRQRTHDLTINNIHTYYVLAGATPVLVHNCNNLTADDARFPAAHVLDEHVNVSDQRLIQMAQTSGVKSRFTDLQTAQQVVDYGIASNQKRIGNWLRGGGVGPLEIKGRFGANNPIGVRADASGSITPTSNAYTIILQRAAGHPGGYYVSTAYPR
ncbi:polymorphic toxin-type HINT domain-containing protein [Streptomyces sp. NBC_01216]|uniref:polymorphic toxin-type HINT domain-containing protein n=1 Tax=Streptomyces sp. NBC_01216 TaxID=2903778 RepID=UPI002E15CC68|nr:polymorphic toxin-type HINT domain-containing protein [Streptomyces sp. NBC_01216]